MGMTVLKDRGLTKGPVDDLARQSFAGMAHFAGTGPTGSSCSKCQNWDFVNQKAGSARCKKYQNITGKPGSTVPDSARGCKYFEAR
jgi:hypothetical protein